ncbi:hypothetical protein [Lentisalinibacter sediminis]|uniref:hypothetical protein n=1 Tax=Lentisalinibacter sediminis TaxID=2992237 RepID=UPI00386DEDEC
MLQLADEDRAIVDRARWQESFWRYGRYVLLIAGAGMLVYGAVASYPTSLDVPACRCVNPALLIPVGASLLASVMLGWKDRQRQLLLRLASEREDPSSP